MDKINHVIIDRIIDRVNQSKDESIASYFLSLTYLGEAVTKITTLVMLNGLMNDASRTKYSLQCQLVQSDGLGDWSKTLDDILIGPSSHLQTLEFQNTAKELSSACYKGSWVHESVSAMRECLFVLGEGVEQIPNKVTFRVWFQYFARLRNKTKGHGAHTTEVYEKLCPLLEKSIGLAIKNLSLFGIETIYLQRNLSGKYRIESIQGDSKRFDHLKTSEGQNHNYEDGVYLFNGTLIRMDLIYSDHQLSDFFIPNGGFAKKTFETVSYVTGERRKFDNANYLIPPNALPGSETDGKKDLDVVGNCFTNIPISKALYIERKGLESELLELLNDDRHAIITLIGRGGIGKTTLALKVLRDLCSNDRFQLVLWFSARDIDLLEEGIKPVKPQVVGIPEIAAMFTKLVSGTGQPEKGSQARTVIEAHLHKSDHGSILFVIDNFETVDNPSEVFKWLDTHVRLPNKVLITSRIKDSKGDYPITVQGMIRAEFNALVHRAGEPLKIQDLITDDFIDQLFQESGGHPYITKIMLGEVAREKKLGSLKRIAAGKDELLTALFERTYNMLSPGAKLVFLTLASWRSIVPALAIEAVIKTKSEDYYEVADAIDELYSFSFVDKIKGGHNEEEYLSLPLAAYIFGQKKLTVSPLKHQISDFVWYLNFFGVGHQSNIQKGIHNKLSLFFRQVAKYLTGNKKANIADFIPICEFVCHRYPHVWKTLSILYEENEMVKEAIEATRYFIQNENNEEDQIVAWRRIALLSRKTEVAFDEAHALVEMSSIKKCTLEMVINNAKRVHELIKAKRLPSTPERKSILSTLIENISSRSTMKDLDVPTKLELAWMHFNNHQYKEAKRVIGLILQSDPNNAAARNLRAMIKH